MDTTGKKNQSPQPLPGTTMLKKGRAEGSTADLFSKALPESFQFYHLGEVRPSTGENHQPSPVFDWKNSTALEGYTAIGFKVLDEANLWFVVLFEKTLDTDVYSELGNILASRFATRLQRLRDGGDSLTISPPQKLSMRLFSKWIETSPPAWEQTYRHLNGDVNAPAGKMVHVLILNPGGLT